MPLISEDQLESELRKLVIAHDRSPMAVEADVQRRVDRSRRRRRVAPWTAIAAMSLGAALVVVSRDQPAEVIAADDGAAFTPSPDSTGDLPTVDQIEIRTTRSGAQAIVTFTDVLTGQPTFTASIDSASPDLMQYTTQERSAVQVCGSVHTFNEDGFGSVDLLLPESQVRWDMSMTQPRPVYDDIDESSPIRGGKAVVCGPHAGFVQVSLWDLAPAEASQVSVTLSDDRRSLVVSVACPAPGDC